MGFAGGGFMPLLRITSLTLDFHEDRAALYQCWHWSDSDDCDGLSYSHRTPIWGSDPRRCSACHPDRLSANLIDGNIVERGEYGNDGPPTHKHDY